MCAFSFLSAIILDLAVGDPHWLPHPVRWIGKLISSTEKILYPPKRSCSSELLRGTFIVVFIVFCTGSITWFLNDFAHRLSFVTGYMFETIIGFYCLSARSLAQEAGKVSADLHRGSLNSARKSLSMIVGRDTTNLSTNEVARAAVETVAENISDGITAPMLCLAIGGPALGIVYKTISTFDSMIGYRNERYRYFGRMAALLDDIFNYIPARLTGLILIPVASVITGSNGVRSLKICLRDRLKHPSPNSAHGEAAVAGALGIRLGGPSAYGGVTSTKPFLGDNIRNIEIKDISRTVCIMYGVTIILLILIFIVLFMVKEAGL